MKVQKNFLVRRCLEIGLSGTMEALVAIVSAVSFILEGLSIGVVAQLVLVHIAARSFAEIPAETVSENWGWEMALLLAVALLFAGTLTPFWLCPGSLWLGVVSEAMTGVGMALWQSALKGLLLSEE
ncbi:TPA: hypothetical protein DEX28_02905 [Patescibacteria group bacterium]|nr:hypothetical protein [Patescibacteria group bacterium]